MRQGSSFHVFPFSPLSMKQHILNAKYLETQLLTWYAQHQRDLPWRHTTDPYRIWLSEVILQQTRVKQGMPYYERFVAAYSTVEALAAAPQDEVLRLWQGLGYYSRAHNMHHTAQQVVEHYGGVFPTTYRDLIALKGVGKYTAAAIASFAYNESVAVVDGNVYRVLARLFGLRDDIGSSGGQKVFAQKAQELVSQHHAREYNQAIMEFGATLCTPQKPNCLFCPFAEQCVAKREGTQQTLPVKARKQKVRDRFFHYLVVEWDGCLFLKQRDEQGIWQGLYDFPNIETPTPLDEEALAARLTVQLPESAFILQDFSTSYTHLLSHQRLHVRFAHLQLRQREAIRPLLSDEKGAFYTFTDIDTLPKPILIQKYLEEKFLAYRNIL